MNRTFAFGYSTLAGLIIAIYDSQGVQSPKTKVLMNNVLLESMVIKFSHGLELGSEPGYLISIPSH